MLIFFAVCFSPIVNCLLYTSPVHMVETINKMNRVGRRFLQEHGREATNEELSKEMGISLETVSYTHLHTQKDPHPAGAGLRHNIKSSGRDTILDGIGDIPSAVDLSLIHICWPMPTSPTAATACGAG